MTDAEITHRVEQAMLGAMMARPRRAAQMNVNPGCFADARHQAIAAALTGTAGSERGLFGRMIAWFTRRSRAARDAAQYLETLPGLCPDPGHIGTYFGMLSADRDQRAAAAQARVQAQGSQVLDVAAERLGQMRGRPDASTGMPRGTARLARALRDRRQQEQAAPARYRVPDQRQAPAQPQTAPQGQAPVQAGPASLPAQGQQARPAGEPAPAPGAPAAVAAYDRAGTRTGADQGRPLQTGRFTRPEDLQDAVLAALMHHPDEAREVVGWLDPEAFTGPRRELYTMIGQHAADGRDIDPVTLAWDASQRAGTRPADTARTEHDGWLRPGDVLRTGALDAAPGTASVLGKTLYADHVCTVSFDRQDWHRGLHRKKAPAPDQEPGAGQQPRTQTQNHEQDQEPGRAPGQSRQNQNRRHQAGQEPAPRHQPAAPNAPGPARAGAGTRSGPVVPGKLIQQPPSAPGQGGMTPNQ